VSTPEIPAFPHARPVLSVGELNRLARTLVEQLPLVWVTGEISNLTCAASGHMYFTLRDKDAQARCTIWRGKAALLGFRPENGQKVEARALATLYEARGEFQLNVETLRPAGLGRLFERFTEIRGRLEAEGLFRAEMKRPLPIFPRHLAIVTSPQAAALRDVLVTLARRAPHVVLTLFPTPVQGENAADGIVQALNAASASACDTIILCRGGGGLEDLWCFNEERVARAIRASRLPVVCGIGHETDFTIADFAADLRAPTPTSAAEQSCPDRQTLLNRLDTLGERLQRRQENRLIQWAGRLDALAARLPSPARQLTTRRTHLAALQSRLQYAGRRNRETHVERLATLAAHLLPRRPATARGRERLASLSDRLAIAMENRQAIRRQRLEQAAQSLRQLDPNAVLSRGYALALNAEGHIVRDATTLTTGEQLHLKLARGETRVQVS
jgi:exodeoxyribonuclease VII large subunit